jgi:hypothetical protein
MSDLSDVILPSGVVLIGLYLVKRYTESTGQGDFSPIGKWCFGPLCLSQYGPPISQTPGQGGNGGTGNGSVDGGTRNWNPLDPACDWPLSWMFMPVCFYKNPLSQGVANG